MERHLANLVVLIALALASCANPNPEQGNANDSLLITTDTLPTPPNDSLLADSASSPTTASGRSALIPRTWQLDRRISGTWIIVPPHEVESTLFREHPIFYGYDFGSLYPGQISLVAYIRDGNHRLSQALKDRTGFEFSNGELLYQPIARVSLEGTTLEDGDKTSVRGKILYRDYAGSPERITGWSGFTGDAMYLHTQRGTREVWALFRLLTYLDAPAASNVLLERGHALFNARAN